MNPSPPNQRTSLLDLLRHFGPEIRANGLDHRVAAGLFAEVGLRLLEPWPIKVVFDYVLARSNLAQSRALNGLPQLTPVGVLTVAAVGAGNPHRVTRVGGVLEHGRFRHRRHARLDGGARTVVPASASAAVVLSQPLP